MQHANTLIDDPKHPIPRWVCIAAILLVLYPLSIGPAIALSNWYHYPSWFYAPIVWLADATGTTDILIQYVYLWIYLLPV